MKRFLAILHARNMEFIRDKSSLGWNILFPLLLVLGFAAVFSGEPAAMFKVGVIGDTATLTGSDAEFFKTKYIHSSLLTMRTRPSTRSSTSSSTC